MTTSSFLKQTAKNKQLVLKAMLNPVMKKEGTSPAAEWPMGINWQATCARCAAPDAAFWSLVDLARFETPLFHEVMSLFRDSDKSVTFVKTTFGKV